MLETPHRIVRRPALQVPAPQLHGLRHELRHWSFYNTIHPDELGEERHEGRVGRLVQPERAGEVLAFEPKVTGVMKVAQGAPVEVQVVQYDGGLRVLAAI